MSLLNWTEVGLKLLDEPLTAPGELSEPSLKGVAPGQSREMGRQDGTR